MVFARISFIGDSKEIGLQLSGRLYHFSCVWILLLLFLDNLDKYPPRVFYYLLLVCLLSVQLWSCSVLLVILSNLELFGVFIIFIFFSFCDLFKHDLRYSFSGSGSQWLLVTH